MASGLRICFPAPGLKEREGLREEGEEGVMDRSHIAVLYFSVIWVMK